MKKIAYQGYEGAFSHLTAVKRFGKGHHFVSAPTFEKLFDLIESGEVDYGVIPIENSLIGSIYENYDLLFSKNLHFIYEEYTKIEHCLLTLSALSEVRRVFSHPKALEQCSLFFQKHPSIQPIVHIDTAGAAQEISLLGDPSSAAIASSYAAECYNLHICQRGIEDHPKNYTRFFIAAKHPQSIISPNKCSLLLRLAHSPGTLVEALQCLSQNKINITKMESRPFRGSFFEYIFYIDFEFHMEEKESIDKTLLELSSKVLMLKLLGFYHACIEQA